MDGIDLMDGMDVQVHELGVAGLKAAITWPRTK
jgi:hypothetical protein